MTHSRPTGPAAVFLGLESISVDPNLGSRSLARIAAATLAESLRLPSLWDLCEFDGRQVALHVRIVDIDGGCHIVRSSTLLTLLGFGNARLKLRAWLHDIRSGRQLASFTHMLQHNGLSRGAEDYLQDNSEALVVELSRKAAHDLTVRARKRLRPPGSLLKLFTRFRHNLGSTRYAYEEKDGPS